MRRIALAFVASLLAIVTLAPGPALAADSVDNAIAGLKTSTVYIEPGTENTTRDSLGLLQSRLKDNDQIILVMLPSTAADDSTSIDDIVQRIDDATGNKYVIGLSVGYDVVGYSSILPSGVASDSMERASSLTNNPVEALATYSKVIHSWQAAHPEAMPTTTTTTTTQPEGLPVVPIAVGGSVVLSIAVVLTLVFRRRNSGETSEADVKFKKTPVSVRDQMESVLDLRKQVHNDEIVTSLTNIGRHTEAYFRNAKVDSGGSFRNAQEIRKGVELLNSVVTRYIKVQNESFYYRDEAKLKSEYHAAVSSFERFMLEQVRSANAHEEFDYRKMADILSATDLRTIRPEGR